MLAPAHIGVNRAQAISWGDRKDLQKSKRIRNWMTRADEPLL
jgi:hypothetical protein